MLALNAVFSSFKNIYTYSFHYEVSMSLIQSANFSINSLIPVPGATTLRVVHFLQELDAVLASLLQGTYALATSSWFSFDSSWDIAILHPIICRLTERSHLMVFRKGIKVLSILWAFTKLLNYVTSSSAYSNPLLDISLSQSTPVGPTPSFSSQRV